MDPVHVHLFNLAPSLSQQYISDVGDIITTNSAIIIVYKQSNEHDAITQQRY